MQDCYGIIYLIISQLKVARDALNGGRRSNAHQQPADGRNSQAKGSQPDGALKRPLVGTEGEIAKARSSQVKKQRLQAQAGNLFCLVKK
jgi:hypothetical protein